MPKPLVYLNGQFLPLDKASVSVMDRGFHYGDGVFETIRVEGGEPHALNDHLARLQKGAKTLGISIPYSPAQIRNAIRTLLQRNQLKNALVKIMLTRGPAQTIGLSPKRALGKPTLCIFSWEIDSQYQKKKSYKIIISGLPRYRTHITGLKSLNYLSHVIAKAEADAAGADEAVFVDGQGHILEGTISNIFIVRHGRLVTPPQSLGILDGITRREALHAARRLHIPLLEQPFTVSDLLHADEAFLTFTSAGIMPIERVNQKKIGLRSPGPLTLSLIRYNLSV